MELLVPSKHLCTISRLSFSPSYLNLTFNGNVSCRRRFSGYPSRISAPLRITIRSEHDSISNGHLNQESEADCEILNGKSSNFIDVLGIGSRKDAVLDFCLESPFQSLTSLRFWNILFKESMKVELQQRSLEQGVILQDVEGRVSLLSSSQAVILVASAGYGLDQNTAIELLREVKSADKLAIGIILKPFSFEGQRRQNEVTDLVSKLQENTHFCIVVDTDALLKTEVVTLSEALRSANDAVLLAMNAISILVSDRHKKIIDGLHYEMKELKIQEALELLESYKRAKVGFGAGNNLKSSIVRAIYDCPFLDGGMKDIDMAVCTIASSDVMGDNDLRAFLRAFRQTTRFEKDIVVSVVCEPNLEPNLILTTVITLCCNEQNVSQKKGFLSNLALHFPFVFSFLGKDHPESKATLPANSLRNAHPSEIMEASGSGDLPNSNSVNGTSESLDLYPEKLETLLGSNYDENSALSDDDQKNEDGIFKDKGDFISNDHRQIPEEEPTFQREPLISRTVGPGFHIAQEWAKERALSGAAPVLDKHSVFTLPVGVKPFEQSTGSSKFPNTPQPSEPRVSNEMNAASLGTQDMRSWDSLTDAGVEAVKEIYNNASTMLKGKSGDSPKKQGVLSVRAASMLASKLFTHLPAHYLCMWAKRRWRTFTVEELPQRLPKITCKLKEAERDSEKKWSPITEMQYRGGIYRGRCQGGLPEGKGRLTVLDGSIYDGMWRYGKKYGPGTLYYGNGDVFQGTWRDDLMHGRGWFYFHAGDRWFVNFWKGKANGEGRFYSKTGEIFFGNFQDGWRHGHSLFIDVDGRRWAEIWDEGMLVSREHQDSEISADITPQK